MDKKQMKGIRRHVRETDLKCTQMQYDNFIKEYILPMEDDTTRLKYYEGNLEFDKEYLLEIATHNNIVIKDLWGWEGWEGWERGGGAPF